MILRNFELSDSCFWTLDSFYDRYFELNTSLLKGCTYYLFLKIVHTVNMTNYMLYV